MRIFGSIVDYLKISVWATYYKSECCCLLPRSDVTTYILLLLLYWALRRRVYYSTWSNLSIPLILEKRMKILPKNFLSPFCIIRIFGSEKSFLKSTQDFNKLYWNWINFIIINAKFFQKLSNFFPNILKILFKIYFKFPTNVIQNLSKIP